MLSAMLIVWGLLTVCVISAQLRRPQASHRQAITQGLQQLRPLLTRLPAALLAAAFLAVLIPENTIGTLFGDTSGWLGIIAASGLGGFLPGGPVVAFPLVVVLFDSGAGIPQLVALITAWSVLAFHRVAAFELPMLGGRATLARVLASAPLPIAAGATAGALMRLTSG
ncbi:MAG: hypothetical protein ACLFMS_05985 [Halorhodospira sp.]